MRFTVSGASCRFAWSHPERGTSAVGFGEVAAGDVGPVGWLRGAPPGALPGPWFGGCTFDPERPWAGFPAERWVLPRVLVWNAGAGPLAAAFGVPGTAIEALNAQIDALTWQRSTLAMPGARLASEDRGAWNAQVAAALSTPGLTKVVLARTATVEADGPWPEPALFEALQARHPSCRTYLWRGDDGSVLIGASPETLCEVRGRHLRTEALAGTSASDRGVALLSSEKDAREHQLVVDGVVAALGAHCTQLTLGGRELRRVGPLTHLRTPVSAILRPGVDPLDAARALHPTPAVCGTPRELALDFIRRHEPQPRGWYAGALGLRGAEALELAVALRCAHVRGRRATLFVGAGIVRGSTPDAEWDETCRKARAMLEALGVPTAPADPLPAILGPAAPRTERRS